MSINESRFNMWRAVVAMIHADDVIQPHEINFILENTRKLLLSDEQLAILSADMKTAQDIEQMFAKIKHPRDKEDFFHFAKAVAWSDGDFDEREQAFLNRIQSMPSMREDKSIMETAMKNFQGIYIEGGTAQGDQNFFSMIKGLLGAKAA